MEPDGFVIDGWEYSFDPSQPMNKTLKVVPEDKRDTPEFLYKYYNLSHLNIDAIKNNYLYAASRFELNDDFDCLEQLIDMKDISNERLITFYSQWHTVAEIVQAVSYTHLRAHETRHDLVCRLLLEKKKNNKKHWQ